MTVKPKIPCSPKSFSYHYENNGDALTLREKKPWIAFVFVGYPMTLFLIGWTVGCAMMIWYIFATLSILLFCFAIPFLAIWIGVFCSWMYLWFGKNTVRLDHDGLYIEWLVFIRIRSKQVPLDEIQFFHAKQSGNNGDTISYSVEAVTSGKPVQISTHNIEEAEWLAYEMNQMQAALKGVGQMEVMPAVAEIGEDRDNADREELDEPIRISFHSKPQNIEPPGDCRWKLSTEFDSVTFAKRGEFSPGGLASITFFMLFWNGILSVFVMEFWGIIPTEALEFFSWEWWCLFVFLIPFEVVGLIIFLVWIYTLFTPFQWMRRHFARDSATCRVQWFGIGRRWYYSLKNCGTMVIEVQAPGGIAQTKIKQQLNREAKSYQLRFVDFQNEELFSINDLTSGEARWIANVILEFR